MTDSLDALLKAADIMLQVGEIEGALDTLNEAVQAAPDDPLPYLRRAEVLASVNQPVGATGRSPLPSAIDDLQKAIDLGMDTADVHFKLMLVLANRDEVEAARREQGRAADLNGDDPRLRDHLREWGIRLAAQAGNTAEALVLARAAMEAEPGKFVWARWEAVLLRASGDIPAARDAFTALIESRAPAQPAPGTWDAPRWAEIYLSRAECHRCLGDFDAALADLDTAEAYLPGDPGIPFARGLVTWGRGDVDGALVWLQQGLDAAAEGVRAALWSELDGYPRCDDLRAAVEKS